MITMYTSDMLSSKSLSEEEFLSIIIDAYTKRSAYILRRITCDCCQEHNETILESYLTPSAMKFSSASDFLSKAGVKLQADLWKRAYSLLSISEDFLTMQVRMVANNFSDIRLAETTNQMGETFLRLAAAYPSYSISLDIALSSVGGATEVMGIPRLRHSLENGCRGYLGDSDGWGFSPRRDMLASAANVPDAAKVGVVAQNKESLIDAGLLREALTRPEIEDPDPTCAACGASLDTPTVCLICGRLYHAICLELRGHCIGGRPHVGLSSERAAALRGGQSHAR